MHEYEQIDDYIASVKQIVWLIYQKLQMAVTKLMFLQSRLRVHLGKDPDLLFTAVEEEKKGIKK